MYQSITQGLAPLQCIAEYQSATFRIWRPVSNTVPLCQSVARCIAARHLDCIPEYLSATNCTKTQSATLLPSISVSNPGYRGLSLEVYTWISVSDKGLPATLYPDVTVSNLGYILRVYRSTGISVSDKVYEDLSGTLFPSVSVSNLGYNSLSPGMFLEYHSATKYMKICQILCTLEYHLVNQSMMQGMEGKVWSLC